MNSSTEGSKEGNKREKQRRTKQKGKQRIFIARIELDNKDHKEQKIQMSTKGFLGGRQVHTALIFPDNNNIQKKKTPNNNISNVNQHHMLIQSEAE